MASRHIGKLAIGGLCWIGILFASLSAAPPTSQPADMERTVAQIAQERFDLLTKQYDLAARRYQQGILSSGWVMQCLRRRAHAARDLPDDALSPSIFSTPLAAVSQSIRPPCPMASLVCCLEISQPKSESRWLAFSIV